MSVRPEIQRWWCIHWDTGVDVLQQAGSFRFNRSGVEFRIAAFVVKRIDVNQINMFKKKIYPLAFVDLFKEFHLLGNDA